MTVKPQWLRVKAPQWERVGNVKEILRDLALNTVCEEASCPNIGECFNAGTATFLIMGPACTRACPYCDIDFEKKPQPLDPTEPERLAQAVQRLKLNHVVITSVNRDDLPDGGASQFVECIQAVRCAMPDTTIEVLIPDLCGNWQALEIILAARPEVLNHNTETVKRLYRKVRPQGKYDRTLELLQRSRFLAPGGFHQIRRYGGARRISPRNSGGDARLAGCRLRYFNSWTVPATDSKALERRKLCASGTI